MRVVVRFIFLLSLLLFRVEASEVRYEKERNNDSVEANIFKPKQLIRGALKQADIDNFLWRLSKKQSNSSWNIIIEPLSEGEFTFEFSKIRYKKAGFTTVGFSKHAKEVKSKELLLSRKITSENPLHLTHLLLKKGKYLLTLHNEGNQTIPYTIKLETHTHVYAHLKADASFKYPWKIALNAKMTLFTMDKKESWFSYTIDKKNANNLWHINTISPFVKPQVILYDANRTRIHDISINAQGKGTLSDLELNEGKYLIQYKAENEGKKFGLKVYTTGSIPLEKEEQEPNNNWKTPNMIKVGKTIHGKIGNKRGDNKTDVADYFSFRLPKAYQNKCIDIQLHTSNKKLLFELHQKGAGVLLERKYDSNYTISSLYLNNDVLYYLSVKGKESAEYSIDFSPPYDRNRSKEREPNDTKKLANLINSDRYVEGEFEGIEWDCFVFDVDVRNYFWNIEANASGMETMRIYRNNRQIAQTQEQIDNQMRLSNLSLSLGTHKVCLKGKKCSYALKISSKKASELSLGKDERFEHEPNNDENHANKIVLNQTIRGVFESKKNEDYFYFTLQNDTYIRLYTKPPKDGDARIKLIGPIDTKRAYPKVGEPSVVEGRFPAGRYVVDLWSEKPSMNPYLLVLERKNPFTATDIEPNDSYATSSIIPLHGHIRGTASKNDKDHYFLPLIQNEVNLTISGMKEKEDIRIYPNDKDNRLPLEWNMTTKSYTVTLKPSLEHYCLYINNGIGSYNYHLRVSDRNQTKQKLEHIHIAAAEPRLNVQSYDRLGQIVPIILKLSSTSSKHTQVHLKTHSSDATWKVLCKELTFELKAGEDRELLCQLHVPKLVSNEKHYITLNLQEDHTEAYTSTTIEIEPKNRHYTWKRYHDWDVQKTLLGGLNLARTEIGAEIVKENDTSARYIERLYDGLIYGDKSFSFYVHDKHRKKDENVTIKLATKEGALIVGTCLHTLGGYRGAHLKDFTFWLSMDGEHFTKSLSATHEKPSLEQCFSLTKPQKARYAKLTLHTNQYNQITKDIFLGEWEVIADPKEAKLSNSINIATPKLGGHIIWSSHDLSAHWDKHILSEEAKIEKREREEKEENLTFVIGFQNERAAKITEMIWQESSKSQRATRLGDATIEVSTKTPFGPWKQVGRWERNATLDENETTYRFETPQWTRYLKFTLHYPKGKIFYPPEKISVFEEKPSKNYYSILGKWNAKSHRAYYEMQRGEETLTEVYVQGNENKNSAFLLENNQSVLGSVCVAQYEEDWYRIEVPKGSNTLTLYVENKEGIDVELALYDVNDSVLTPNQIKKEPAHHIYTYLLSVGNYHLRVYQPPVNVIFAWDHSGSVSPYSSQIATAVNHYVSSIKEGIDAVNLLCFNDPDYFLLSELRDEVEVVERVFNDFDWRCDGSNADQSLKNATLSLEKQTGIKGVIIIGDADGYRDMKLWKALKEVRPKVFSIRVASSYEDRRFEGVMQSWTRVNNGNYHVVRKTSEMTQAIDHAVHTLRQPVSYNLRAKQSYRKPLGKGTLKVTMPPKIGKRQLSKTLGVELILDASGSMLKRIKGKRRINIAKEVLKHTVTRTIPKGTLTVLRVFGHKEADSCRTDIEIPMQPLNPYSATRKIDHIMAKNLAKTPIASSLAKVATDLKDFKGKKVVILVTDGKETCEGDPAKEIRRLKELGIDVRINIVGFAIDDKALKEQFKQWAKLGDGEYFEAHDKDSLNEAMQKALLLPYRVYDTSNTIVATGKVGDTGVKLKGGVYKVVVDTVPPATFKKVVVKGEEATTVKIRELKK